MTDCATARDLSVLKFTSYLRKMAWRAHEEVHGSCYAIFSEQGRQPERHGRISRYVQFCFQEERFALDMPNKTIYAPECRKLMRDRSGFFLNADVPDYRISSYEQIKVHDPVDKYYIYGEEETAAQDMAYIFFDLWGFPDDTQLFVNAASFGSGHRWEWYAPIE